ncbi:MAG: glycosyltransferase family 39 protein [Actinomycetota bacterium]|nr:glycosyltransferase family 39 protein [Actinomycetota bacterium]
MRGVREHLLIICLFLVLVFFLTLPFVIHMQDTVISSHVDNLLNTWIMSWDGHAVATNPTALFQANINYPSSDSLAFSEHLFSFAIVAELIAIITGNAVFAYNFVSLIAFALCGYTMYLLVKYLTGNRWGALAAGVFFALVPYHFSTIVHVHVSAYCLQPLLLLFLFKYFDRGKVVDLAGLGLTFLAQSLLSWYQLAFCSIPIALFLLWQLISHRRREKVKQFVLAIAVLLLCMMIIIPFAIPYFRLHREMPEKESEPAINVIAHASIKDYLRVLPQNWLYDKLGFLPTGSPGAGNALFPGFMIFPLGLLALIFMFASWRNDSPASADAYPNGEDVADVDTGTGDVTESREAEPPGERAPPGKSDVEEVAPPRSYLIFFLVLGIISFALSIGPDPHGVSNIFYKALHKLPIYGFVRFPIRYHIMVILSLAVVAGYACTYIYQYLKHKKGRVWGTAVVSAVILLMLLEFFVVNLPYVKVETGDEVPRVYYDLDEMDDAIIVEAPMPFVDNSVIFEDPLTINYGTLDNTFNAALQEQDATYFSIYHWREMINGMSGYYPLFYRRSLVEMQSFPSPRALDFLVAAGVTHIVFHWDRVPEEEKEAVRNALEELSGLGTVKDYADGISLYSIACSESAGVEQLELQPSFPQVTPPGGAFNAGLILLNPTAFSFCNKDESRQHLELTWRNDDGEVKRAKTYFYAPFFIPSGEGAVASFASKAPSETGDYTLTVSATDGILRGWTWDLEVAVGGVPDNQSGGTNLGELALDSGKDTLVRYPAETFSLFVRARNQGGTQWPRDSGEPVGSVGITAVWNRNDDPDYEMQQQGMLPCDMSPSQALIFPIALQAPVEDGEYTLTMRINILGVEYLGTPVTLTLNVERERQMETEEEEVLVPQP